MGTKKKKSTQPDSASSDPYRWGKTVRVSNEIYEFIVKNGEFGESVSDVLKRLLKI